MRKIFGQKNYYKNITTLILAMLLSACATNFGEEHYFQSINSETGEVSNYMRLTVSGYAYMSSARYVAGYYDERAVDLFFNELKVAGTTDGTTSTNGFMQGDLNNPGTQDKILPLSPTNENGAFVMVLSSNASSVTNVIGAVCRKPSGCRCSHKLGEQRYNYSGRIFRTR